MEADLGENIQLNIVDGDSKYERYLENMRKANKKYRDNNKDKLRELSKNYYDKNKDNEIFREKCREKARRAYQKKVINKLQTETLLVLQT